MRLRRFVKLKPRSRMGLGVHVALVLVVAVILAAAIGVVLWWLLGRPPLRQAVGWTTANSFEFAKIVLALIGGVGAVVALVIAYRKQHLGEAAEQREDIKLFAERFTKASDQLGSDKAPVRLAGMYALEDLAQGTPSQRQTIVNVLCAYLRMPYDLPERTKHAAAEQAAESEAAAQPVASGEHAASTTLEVRKQELQVRLTAQRILADHLRPGLSLRRPETTYWGSPDADINIDLTGATLIDFDLMGCCIGIGRFDGAIFEGNATFREVMFSGGAMFIGATFSEYAWFSDAKFGGGAWFTEVRFRGDAWFADATFSKYAGFYNANFSGEAWFGDAAFSEGAAFTEAIFSEYTGFRKATFSGHARFDSVTFGESARFTKVTFNRDARFEMAVFSGTTDFVEATFGGDAGFDKTTFGGVTWFVKATFRANAWFVGATFGGDTWFMEATFSGDAGFDKATFNANGFFADATFGGDAWFAEATFTRSPMLDEARLRLDAHSPTERNWLVAETNTRPCDKGVRLPDAATDKDPTSAEPME